MKKYFIVLTILMLLILTAIRLKPATIIYGKFAGMCLDNCGTMYQVTDKVISKDTTNFWKHIDNLPQLTFVAQNFAENDEEGSYNNLKIGIPLAMLLDPRTSIGCPDCSDQGGYYLKFTLLGITRYFLLDKNNKPIYYFNLTSDISHMIEKTEVEMKLGNK